MTIEPVRAGSEWLALREPADAAARSTDLVEQVSRALDGGATIHDLGCGTGAMVRWLAPRLPGPQHWVLHDRDAELLDLAASAPPVTAADGTTVSVETRAHDITRLDEEELAAATLVTASALLDMLTAQELERLVRSCARAACPVLVSLSVVGRVELAPADPLDRPVMDAFNAHQRRDTPAGRLLGPDAAAHAASLFRRRGRQVTVRSSPWRLGAGETGLVREWFSGWLGAACEQRPELAEPAEPYARRRLEQLTEGTLTVTVHHQDILVT